MVWYVLGKLYEQVGILCVEYHVKPMIWLCVNWCLRRNWCMILVEIYCGSKIVRIYTDNLLKWTVF